MSATGMTEQGFAEKAVSALNSVGPVSHCPWYLSERFRLAVYAVAIFAVGGATCFYQLDRGMLFLDEAYFAYTTEHMLRTGDYIVPSIGEAGPHLYAAPLYNWLCCITADVFGDGALRYRAWCAAFGVGCALAALFLGTVVLAPEVGLLAGLFLATNHDFLFTCGAREGRMDPPLAFFVTLALIAAIKAQRTVSRGLGWWGVVGASLGCALLMKPPPFACFFFTVISGHHLLTRRDLSLRTRLHGPALAALVMALCAVPWYVAIYTKLGWHGLDEHIVSTSIGRVKKSFGRQEPWWFYLTSIWDSSLAFKLSGMGMFWGIVSAVRGRGRDLGFLVVVAALFVSLISVSASRCAWYAYPIYPTLAVLIAAFLLAGLQFRPSTIAGKLTRGLTVLGGIAAAGALLEADVADVRRFWNYQRTEYPPLLVQQTLDKELTAGEVRLVLLGFPQPGEPLCMELQQTQYDFSPSERVYMLKLPQAVVAKTVPELQQSLDDGKPTIVFIHHQLTPKDLASAGLQTRPDSLFELPSKNGTPYTFLSFHDAEATLRLRDRLGDACRPVKR